MQQSYKYLDSLDDSQRAAVEYIDGPSLVIAGAGAGKTRVLTTKVAYLIDSGIDPWNIEHSTAYSRIFLEQKPSALDTTRVSPYTTGAILQV